MARDEVDPDRVVEFVFITAGCVFAALFAAFLALKLNDAREDWAAQRACRAAGQRVVIDEKEWHCSGPVPAERP